MKIFDIAQTAHTCDALKHDMISHQKINNQHTEKKGNLIFPKKIKLNRKVRKWNPTKTNIERKSQYK